MLLYRSSQFLEILESPRESELMWGLSNSVSYCAVTYAK